MSRTIMSRKNLTSIGKQIRELREGINMPLRKLSSLLDLDQSTLSKIERGERKANIQIINKISEIFNINKKELLINFYSDNISYEIVKQQYYSEILEVAEAKIEYIKSEREK